MEDLGDCIDCTMCVQVCPTGIDIRNGLQYECIACGACIDACDSVMDKMGYARGLIRYSTQNAIEGQPTRILRPRIVIYGVLLAALLAAWGWGITHRSALIVDVLRDRNALYRVVEGGGSENGYTVKLVNKSDSTQRYRVVLVSANPSITLVDPQQILEVPAASVGEFPITVRAPSSVVGRQSLQLQIQAEDRSVQKRVDSSYFGPL